jgi:TPP-dependent pyruvate/acetoin dehydrogenase alpha subunit
VTINKKMMLDMYELLLLIRESERTMTELFKKGELSGHIIPSLGQEAIPTGFSKALKSTDYVITGHRGGGHYIARDCDFNGMWAELYAKSTGILKGRGGQLHLMDLAHNTIAGNAIVGTHYGFAVGAGLAAKQNNNGAVVAVFGGEGSTNRGTFHESMNMASLWKLPIIYVCEFNGKQMWDKWDKILPSEDIARRSYGYGIPSVNVDGTDPVAVYIAAAEAIENARSGKGPSFMVCKTYKWTDTGSNVRHTKEEADYLKENFDPIKLFKKRLNSEGILNDKIDTDIQKRVNDKVNSAIEFGRKSAPPTFEDVHVNLYSTPILRAKEGAE